MKTSTVDYTRVVAFEIINEMRKEKKFFFVFNSKWQETTRVTMTKDLFDKGVDISVRLLTVDLLAFFSLSLFTQKVTVNKWNEKERDHRLC